MASPNPPPKVCAALAIGARLACVVLRTSRFFPEEDDDRARRAAYAADNCKAPTRTPHTCG
jgi:hypothetical protein